MPKLKNILYPAVSGFVLSFLITLIATRHILLALFRGALWAAGFAALAAGISFLYEKFLSEGLGSDSLSENQSRPVTGNVVDITISDEELTPDDSGPRFDVSGERAAPLSAAQTRLSDMSETEALMARRTETVTAPRATEHTVAQSPAPESKVATASEPLASAKTDAGSKEPATFTPVNLAGQPVSASQSSGAAEDIDNLDELPEIGELNLVGSGSSSVEETSEFAEEGEAPSSSRVQFADGSSPASHDAETMAKAIRTLLKRED
ncbi:MAG TPA: hypothetical protein DCQ43_04695 [Treponema sp.]|nr:hypothetical protein [Treponema sp.]